MKKPLIFMILLISAIVVFSQEKPPLNFKNNFSFSPLMFDLYLGGGMRRTNDYNKNSEYRYYGNSIWDHGYNGIAPKVGFNVGFSF